MYIMCSGTCMSFPLGPDPPRQVEVDNFRIVYFEKKVDCLS